MGLNTYPYNPFPASTDKLDEVHNEQIQEEVDQLKSGLTTLDNEVNGDATTYPYADVITIPDAVPANVADCNVKIEPVQDLHGYDKPWVGGAGKNKCPLPTAETQNGVTLIHNANGSFTIIGTASANTYFDFFAGNYEPSIYNGLVFYASSQNVSWSTSTICFRMSGSDRVSIHDLLGNTEYTLSDSGSNLYFAVRVSSGFTIPTGGITIYPMIRSASETNDWSPYTNICPITGHTEASVEVTDGDETTKTYTIALGDTIYGGTVDFDSGVMTVTMACIESYDGETIGEPWISDRDVYAAGTTPTTGAQVVYTLSESTTVQLTPQQIQLLKGTNTLTASTGQISVTVNGVSGAIGAVQEQVNATDAVLAELAEQLPTAPTTDGAYVLTVTVASGTPTYSWESAE